MINLVHNEAHFLFEWKKSEKPDIMVHINHLCETIQNNVPSWAVPSWLGSAGDSSTEPDSAVELAEVSSAVDAVDGASSGPTFAGSSSAARSCDRNGVQKQQQNESGLRHEGGKLLIVVSFVFV